MNISLYFSYWFTEENPYIRSLTSRSPYAGFVDLLSTKDGHSWHRVYIKNSKRSFWYTLQCRTVSFWKIQWWIYFPAIFNCNILQCLKTAVRSDAISAIHLISICLISARALWEALKEGAQREEPKSLKALDMGRPIPMAIPSHLGWEIVGTDTEQGFGAGLHV